ncbi:hypothetical protein [Streptomyces sp. TRM64462]|uniref:hypothetical protein n=1 Tax=Streptomyces sp. TRM64462 TaxID=2741726 RepID=UPI0015864EDF|nr:hypothetical protein [Streptomyces sp. TRM64462]
MTRQTHPDLLRLEAAQKRQELADTLDQLMARTDLRARAAQMDYRPVILVAAAVGAAAVAAGVLLTLARHGGRNGGRNGGGSRGVNRGVNSLRARCEGWWR